MSIEGPIAVECATVGRPPSVCTITKSGWNPTPGMFRLSAPFPV